jgi:hypothetical protein
VLWDDFVGFIEIVQKSHSSIGLQKQVLSFKKTLWELNFTFCPGSTALLLNFTVLYPFLFASLK